LTIWGAKLNTLDLLIKELLGIKISRWQGREHISFFLQR